MGTRVSLDGGSSSKVAAPAAKGKAAKGGGGGASMDKAQKVKIAVAGVILVLAAGLILINTGVLDTTNPAETRPEHLTITGQAPSQEEQQLQQKIRKEREEWNQKIEKTAPPAGS
ncbi:MAG: hypothetical protein SFZ23_02190 [Planctomycetota bacterium]|nr:hypothetical protein [Planctomycetota bacterium]